MRTLLVRGTVTAIAALFVFSAVMKLRDPLAFAFAIRAFKLDLPIGVAESTVYAVPWLELTAAAGLLIGPFRRAAAHLVTLLMLAFAVAIASLKLRGLDVSCPCFGSIRLICPDPLGTCHVVRNLAIAALLQFCVRKK